MPESQYVLELKGITKIFPGVKALNKVQFQLKPGEVHALMGENGAGKSTFIKVITGVHKAEEGEMYLHGQKVDFKGPRDAQAAGIAAVYQHATSYPDLTVAENIFMGHEIIKHGIIQWRAMNEEANKLLKRMNADFSATAEMGTLSVAEQQIVEIAKALSTNPSSVTPPYLAMRCFSREPLLTPTLIGIFLSLATATTLARFSLEPMLPGLILILSAPFSMAAMAIL